MLQAVAKTNCSHVVMFLLRNYVSLCYVFNCLICNGFVLHCQAEALQQPRYDVDVDIATTTSQTEIIPMIHYVSQPVAAGDTVLVGGSGFTPQDNVDLISLVGDKRHWKVTLLKASNTSCMFTIPEAAGSGPWDMRIAGSTSVQINVPDIWWWQGDEGASSTPGGWLRVFGLSLGDPIKVTDDNIVNRGDRQDSLEENLKQALKRKDYTSARNFVDQLESQHHYSLFDPLTTIVTLVPANSNSTDENIAEKIQIKAVNASSFEAFFEIPESITPQIYNAHLQRGEDGPMVQFKSFMSPTEPAYRTVSIIPKVEWDFTNVFKVHCKLHLPVWERPCGWVGVRSQLEINVALQHAAQNGGGIVELPRGQYYIDGPIVVPDNVRLRGESRELTSVYFREDNQDTAPKPGYIYGSGSRWGIEDITLYVSHFYHSVIFVDENNTNFEMFRTRVRAAAYAALPFACYGANGRGHRLANYSSMSLGEVVYLAGNNNFKIIGNDLLGTNIIIHTGSNPGHQSGATYGIVSWNEIYNGNAAHWFDDIKNVIFEHNQVSPGGSGNSWGNNIDNYGAGYNHHMFHAYNTFKKVWAGDREMITFDPVTGNYNGLLHHVHDDGVTLRLDTHGDGFCDKSSLGGAVSVLEGTGSGQYRRIVAIKNNFTVVVDQPFAVPLDATSHIQGKILIFSDEYSDGGAIQTYGNAMDVVIANVKFERVEGLLSWGRSTGTYRYAPNLRIQFLNNHVLEGNHWWNYNGSYAYVDGISHPKVIDPYFFGVLGSDQDPQPCMPYPHRSSPNPCPPSLPEKWQGSINHLITIRGNVVHNNGGIDVRGHTQDVLVNRNIIIKSHVGVHVNDTHAFNVALVDNKVHE